MYTTRICGYCVAAKRLLHARGVPFEEIDVSRDDKVRMDLVRRYHWRTVPVILAGEDLIGGYTELAALDRERGLDHLR